MEGFANYGVHHVYTQRNPRQNGQWTPSHPDSGYKRTSHNIPQKSRSRKPSRSIADVMVISNELATCPNSNNLPKYLADTVTIVFYTGSGPQITARSGIPSPEGLMKRMAYLKKASNFIIGIGIELSQKEEAEFRNIVDKYEGISKVLRSSEASEVLKSLSNDEDSLRYILRKELCEHIGDKMYKTVKVEEPIQVIITGSDSQKGANREIAQAISKIHELKQAEHPEKDVVVTLFSKDKGPKKIYNVGNGLKKDLQKMVEEEITSEPVNIEESLNRIKRGTVFSFSTPDSFKNYQYPNYQPVTTSFGQPRNQIVLQSGYDSNGMQDPKFQQLAQNFIKDYTNNNYSPYNRQPTQRKTIQCEQRGNQLYLNGNQVSQQEWNQNCGQFNMQFGPARMSPDDRSIQPTKNYNVYQITKFPKNLNAEDCKLLEKQSIYPINKWKQTDCLAKFNTRREMIN
jgi:hypothetical protein